jgi:hypothetical protein
MITSSAIAAMRSTDVEAYRLHTAPEDAVHCERCDQPATHLIRQGIGRECGSRLLLCDVCIEKHMRRILEIPAEDP